MIRVLVFWLALATTAHAKTEFVSCYGDKNDTQDAVSIKGTLDREKKSSGAFLIEQRDTKNITILSDVALPRDLRLEDPSVLWSSWMNYVVLTLPKPGEAFGELRLNTLSGIRYKGKVECIVRETPPEYGEKLNMCYENLPGCQAFVKEFGHNPELKEKDAFLARLRKADRLATSPAPRALLECSAKTNAATFKVRGSVETATGDNSGLRLIADDGREIEAKIIVPTELVWGLDAANPLTYRTLRDKQLFLEYQGNKANVRMESQGAGSRLNFDGVMTCTLTRATRDEQAKYEMCVRRYRGCEAFRAKHKRDPGPRDVEALYDLETEVLGMDPDRWRD